jgi:hypothetical protein
LPGGNPVNPHFKEKMKAPKFPSFIKLNQNSRYKPRYRYYDPEKERLDELKKKYGQSSDEDSADGIGMRMRSDFRRKAEDTRKVKRGHSSSRTLVIIILALLAGVIWMLKTDMFERILSSFLDM